MQSTPLRVTVIPFHTSSWSGVEYCLAHRAPGPVGEGISGVGDGSEPPAIAARRAACDAGVDPGAALYQLESMDTVPVTARERRRWTTDRYVVARYTFGLDIGDEEIVPPEPDAEWAWLGYPAAHDALAERSLQNALWELHERINCRDLGSPVPAGRVARVRAVVAGPVLPNLRDGAGGALSG